MTLTDPKVIWGLVSFFAALSVIGILIKMHFSKDYKKFNLLEIFAFDKYGKPSATKIRLNLAFLITCWAFIYLTMADKLTEWYVLIYIGAWVTDNIMDKKQRLQDMMHTNTSAPPAEGEVK